MAISLGGTSFVTVDFRGTLVRCEFTNPTKPQYMQYQGKMMSLVSSGKRRDDAFLEHNIRWGRHLLVSFDEKDEHGEYVFTRPNGEPLKTSDDDWKDILEQYAPGLIANLAVYAFASSTKDNEFGNTEEEDAFLEIS